MTPQNKTPPPLTDFYFSCRLCGECCCGSTRVFLNPQDVRTLGAFLGFADPLGLFEAGYLRLDLGQNGFLFPRLRFRGRRPGYCPFAENRVEEEAPPASGYRCLCRLHPAAKPLVCRLSPLARELRFSIKGGCEETWLLVPPVKGCPGCVPPSPSPSPSPIPLLNREKYLESLREELDREAAFFRALSASGERDALKNFAHFYGFCPPFENFFKKSAKMA